MTPQEAKSQMAGFRVVITNGGTHSVETTTAMSMSSFCDANSNPVKMAHMRAQLEDLYFQARKTVHALFDMVANEKGIDNRHLLKANIVQILVRDFNTLLDIERQLYKE